VASVAAKPAASMDMDKHMSQMQQNMKTMQVQMEQVLQHDQAMAPMPAK
jgi:hypothetical protein